MPADRLRMEIAQHVASRLAAMRGRDVLREDRPEFVRTLEANLGPCVVRDDFASDFAGEESGRIASSGGVHELCAVHSSAALAVNTFGPFRRSPQCLRLAGRSMFTAACFGKRLRTGLGGAPPFIDFYAYGAQGIVAVEGRFTETVSRKRAGFSSSYARLVSELADTRWTEVYDLLCREPARYAHLDAARLVRHYLGIRHSLRDEPQPKALLYVFWEPENWPEVREFALHRREVLRFSMSVTGGDVEFSAMSYSELWNAWESEGVWDGREKQLAYLRERYDFPIEQLPVQRRHEDARGTG